MSEIITDEELLCEKGDLIDNSVFGLISDLCQDKDPNQSVSFVLNALCLETTPKEMRDNINTEAILTLANGAIAAGNLQKGKEPEWDMSVIGPLTDDIEEYLSQCGCHVCRPWEEDECICYACRDCCTWCREKTTN